MQNAEVQALIERVYSAFNRRDVDGVLGSMSDSVSWPKASEGGRVIGKEEIRAYWTRQWKEFDPRGEPLEVMERADGKIEVRVHQLLKSLTWGRTFRQRSPARLHDFGRAD